MRGQRAKRYRKQMQQYSLAFGFREPYQILITPSILLDAARLKIDLLAALERTVQGKVKPMITQCSIRHLFNLSTAAASTNKSSSTSPSSNSQTNPPSDADIQSAITFSKTHLERKRCNHHELPEPLSAQACIRSCVDPKGSRTNTHRYCVAAQEQEIRAELRAIPGVPLVYITRSVMILEPMSGMSVGARDRGEREKFVLGLKRKRGGDGGEEAGDQEKSGEGMENGENGETQEKKKKKRKRGPKGPNPLSVKKPKKRVVQN